MPDDPLVSRILGGGFLDPEDLGAKEPTPAPRSPPTSGRYVIEGRLGKGGQGEVFRARDTVMGREVAIKRVALPQNDLRRRTALEREVRALVELRHEGIPSVFDALWYSDRVDLVLELVPGRSIEQALDEGVAFEPLEAARIVAKLARTLGHLHAKGFVHRDVKPANVILHPDGLPRLVDFGLAKNPDKESTRVTRTGAIVGTPLYMSPEQATGRVKDVDARADVYGLGALLWTLLAGEEPFEGDSVFQIVVAVAAGARPVRSVNPGVPEALAAIVARAMSVDRVKRPSNGSELAVALEAWIESTIERSRRQRQVAAGVAVVALALPIGAALAFVGRSPPEPRPTPSPELTLDGDEPSSVSSATSVEASPSPSSAPSPSPSQAPSPSEILPSPEPSLSPSPSPEPSASPITVVRPRVTPTPRERDAVDDALEALDAWDRERPITARGELDTEPLARAVASLTKEKIAALGDRGVDARCARAMRWRLAGRPVAARDELPGKQEIATTDQAIEAAIDLWTRSFPDCIPGPFSGGAPVDDQASIASAFRIAAKLLADDGGTKHPALAQFLEKVLELGAVASRELAPQRGRVAPWPPSFSRDVHTRRLELTNVAKAAIEEDAARAPLVNLVHGEVLAMLARWDDAGEAAGRAIDARPHDAAAHALRALARAGPSFGRSPKSAPTDASIEQDVVRELAAAFALDPGCPEAAFVLHRALGDHYGSIPADWKAARPRRLQAHLERLKTAHAKASSETAVTSAYALALGELAWAATSHAPDLMASAERAQAARTAQSLSTSVGARDPTYVAAQLAGLLGCAAQIPFEEKSAEYDAYARRAAAFASTGSRDPFATLLAFEVKYYQRRAQLKKRDAPIQIVFAGQLADASEAYQREILEKSGTQ